MQVLKWSLLKQKYPIGYRFTAKIVRIKPYGIFVELHQVETEYYKYLGFIDIVRSKSLQDSSQQLPFNFKKLFKEGSNINCVVSYYRKHNKQIGLGWLGFDTIEKFESDRSIIEKQITN